jgi:hypothetical protein
MTTTTPNMNLVLAEPEVTEGPQWAELLNEALQLIDEHDHTSENGVPITPAGMDINTALPFGGNNATDVGAVALRTQDSAVTATVGSIQKVGTNLWWINGAGVGVQITSGGSVVSTGSGVLSVSVPAAYPYTVVSGDAQSVLSVDTSAARTINLPAATTAMYFIIKDSTGSCATNNITIVPDGTDTIEASNSSFVMNSNFQSIGLISDGISAWLVI